MVKEIRAKAISYIEDMFRSLADMNYICHYSKYVNIAHLKSVINYTEELGLIEPKEMAQYLDRLEKFE